MTVSIRGETIHYVWDYAKDEPVDSKLMTKARQKASDIALGKLMDAQYGKDLQTNNKDAKE